MNQLYLDKFIPFPSLIRFAHFHRDHDTLCIDDDDDDYDYGGGCCCAQCKHIDHLLETIVYTLWQCSISFYYRWSTTLACRV